MTSADIINELAGVKTIGEENIKFTKSQVLWAAHFAQNDILTRVKVVDQTIQLALAEGQERYTFAPQTPTAIAQAVNDEVILTIEGHPFHAGDEVVVAGVGTGADGRWHVTIPDADNIQLVGSDTAPALGTSPKVYHALQAAIETLQHSPIRKLSKASGVLTGFLDKKSRQAFQKYRNEFGTGNVAEGLVINFMEEYTSPCITLHVQGIPNEDILTEVTFKRRPLPCEKPTETIDPFLPFEYDDLFLLGIKAFMYRDREEKAFVERKESAMKEYKARLKEVYDDITSRRVVYTTVQPEDAW